MEPATLPGRLLATLQFFVALPLPKALADRADHSASLAANAVLFPVAGLFVGLAPALAWWIAVSYLPAGIAAAIALAVSAWVSGALHEDGLADCADGLGGGKTPERALAIMKDPAIGAFGASALILSFLLRWAALTAMPVTGGLALIAAHASSRSAIVTAMAWFTYARPQGTGSLVAEGISQADWLKTLAIGLLITMLFAGWGGGVAALTAFTTSALLLWRFHARIGGYTGDCLGGMQQVAEITALVVLAGFAAS